jgi:hypothetical protein
LVDSCLELRRQLSAMSDYNRVPQLVLNGFGGQRTIVLLAQRLVLPDQVIALRLHLLHLVVVLGEGTIKLGLQQGGVSWPCSTPPKPLRGAPYCRTLEAYQTSVRISQRRSAEGNTVNKYSLQRYELTLRVLAMYLRAVHRLHVNKVISQQLQTTTMARSTRSSANSSRPP